MLGPLTNPARARRQVLGVYDAALVRLLLKSCSSWAVNMSWLCIPRMALTKSALQPKPVLPN